MFQGDKVVTKNVISTAPHLNLNYDNAEIVPQPLQAEEEKRAREAASASKLPVVEEKEEPDVEAAPATDPADLAEVSGETQGEESEVKEGDTEAEQTAATEEGETTEGVWQLCTVNEKSEE